MTHQPIRVGFVGAGTIAGHRHVPNLRASLAVELASVVNRTPASSAAAAARSGFKGTPDPVIADLPDHGSVLAEFGQSVAANLEASSHSAANGPSILTFTGSRATLRLEMRSHRLELQDFADAIRDDRAPAVTGADGRASGEMVEATRRSSALGRSVTLPLMPMQRQ